MGNLQSIVYLSEEEYKTLITNQTITKNGRTLTYNENSLYITPETGQEFYETIAKTVFTVPSSVSATPTQEGGVNPTTGNNMSGTQYYRTGYCNFTNNMLFKLNHNDYKYTMWLYSNNNNIESKICSLTNQDWYSGLTLIPNDKGGLYFRICYTRKDGAALTATDVETITANAFLFEAIVPSNWHQTVFYGLATAAGDNTQSASSNVVGTYTEDAKSAINEMLGSAVSVSGETPSITAKPGVRYVCGTVTSLTFTPSSSGICDVRFTSGSTVTVLTVPSTIMWPSWFDPTSLDANTTYEINVMDGIYGAVAVWT